MDLITTRGESYCMSVSFFFAHIYVATWARVIFILFDFMYNIYETATLVEWWVY